MKIEIERRSAVEQVADGLRANMLDGSLPPGTRLRELELAETLGVARSTVREALIMLRNERMVSRRSEGRGWEVRRLSAGEIDDIFKARIALETAAINAARGAGPEAVAPLRRSVDELAATMKSDDKLAILDADFQCHLALIRLLDSQRLVDMYAELLVDLRLSLANVERPSDWPRELKNHRRFIRLLERGEFDEADEVLARRLEHVRSSLSQLLAPDERMA